MRPCFHTFQVLVLLAAFGEAPHHHFHPADPDHDHDHHHAVEPLHDLPLMAGQLGWEAPDHDASAQSKHWLEGAASDSSLLLATLVEYHQLVPAAGLRLRLRRVNPRSHDPPSVLALHPRPPPFFPHA